MLENSTPRLTQFSHGSGCGCKIAPQVLEKMLAGNRNLPNPNLWVGNTENDDAAVWAWDEKTGLVSTVDFFTPMVDDPFIFGQAAAANALSDVYAMGGKPIFALAILGWPVEKLPAEMANQVLEGARIKCAEAGIPLAGGHSIDSQEPFFGLVVNGKVEKNQLKKNSGAKTGDLIFLTKPLGIGILAAGAKRGLLEPSGFETLHQQLVQLNQIGEKLGNLSCVHAMTDVTGFGLMGHLCEMAEASGLSAEISFGKLPILAQARPLMAQNCIPDATYRNWNAYSSKVQIEASVDPMASFQILPDPQTNGGLLMAVAENGVNDFISLLEKVGMKGYGTIIGRFLELGKAAIQVTP